MKKMVIAAILSSAISTLVTASNFDIGLSGDHRGISGFSLSIGDYYRVPYREVVMIQRSIPREEMSVVYLLSRHSRYDAQFIVNLRLQGHSWWDITYRVGLDPRTLYVVETNRYHRPPYGKAYGYHSRHLNDSDIIDLSNVIFLSRYHGVSPDDIISRRYKGERYIVIDNYYRTRHTENTRYDEWKERKNSQKYEKHYEKRDRYREKEYDRDQERYEDHKDKMRNRAYNSERNDKRDPHSR